MRAYFIVAILYYGVNGRRFPSSRLLRIREDADVTNIFTNQDDLGQIPNENDRILLELFREDAFSDYGSMSMPLIMDTTITAKSSTVSKDCILSHVYCGDNISKCFKDGKWGIQLNSIDDRDSLTCEVRQGVDECHLSTSTQVVGSVTISEDKMNVNVPGYTVKDIQTTAPSSQVSLTTIRGNTVSVQITLCPCSTSEFGCGVQIAASEEEEYIVPSMPPSTDKVMGKSEAVDIGTAATPSEFKKATVKTTLPPSSPLGKSTVKDLDSQESELHHSRHNATIITSCVTTVLAAVVVASIVHSRRKLARSSAFHDEDNLIANDGLL